jgi:hypothetical protein
LPWEETQGFIRSGHRDPSEFEPDSLRTIWISEEKDIKAVVGKPKGETKTEVVSYLFMKEKDWTLEKANAWFREHQSETRHEHLCCLTPILEKIMDKPHWAITEKGKQFLKVRSKNTDEQHKKGKSNRSHKSAPNDF